MIRWFSQATPFPLNFSPNIAIRCAKGKLDEIDRDFRAKFGRGYGGQIEEYRTEDAEFVIVTMGSATGTARVVVDRKREQGVKLGLIKIRMFRPSPRERLIQALSGKKAVGVIDRSVCYGWNCGHNYIEIRTLLSDLLGPPPKLLDFIVGLGGGDITSDLIERAIDGTLAAAQGKDQPAVTWLSLE
jgi:pyruvate ferredoxin oxidoreductase alpha subunit